MTQIAAGKTPAAMCSYLNPGCKITAINGQAVKGLTFHDVKTRLQRAKTSVVLSIEEPLSLLHGENFHNRDSSCTWPVEAENGYLRKSLSEAQIRYVNSFQADVLQTIDLTCRQEEQGTSPDDNGAKPIPVPALGSLPSPPNQDMGYMNGASNNPGSGGIATPCETPKTTCQQGEQAGTSPHVNDAKLTPMSAYVGLLPSPPDQDVGYMNGVNHNPGFSSIEESSTSLLVPPEPRETPTCQQEEQGTNPNVNDAKPTARSVYAGHSPSLPGQDKGYMNGASCFPDCFGIQESGTSLIVPPKPHETPTDQDMPLCQNCLSISMPDKREQTIEYLPGEIYYFICLKLDIVTPFFHHDYRILGEKLGFGRPEISLLRNSDQPTDHLLNEWVARKGRGATVGVLMDVFDKTERHDLLDILKTWTENCTKCFEYQQENVKETDI